MAPTNRFCLVYAPNLRGKAIRTLQFLVYFERPLEVEEAVDAIGAIFEDLCFDPEERISDPRKNKRYYSSLIVVVSRQDHWARPGECMQLRLAHASVKEYLTSERLRKDADVSHNVQEVAAEASIVKARFAYLLHRN